jgi:hypothetical protein
MNRLTIILISAIVILSGTVIFLFGKLNTNLGADAKILNDTYLKGQSDLANEIVNIVKTEQKIIIPVDGQNITMVPEQNIEPLNIEPTISESIGE